MFAFGDADQIHQKVLERLYYNSRGMTSFAEANRGKGCRVYNSE